MQKILHLVTVGTSIIRNSALYSDKYAVLEKWKEKLSCWASSSIDSDCDIEAGNNATPSSSIFRDVASAVCSDPYRLSAELNSMLRFIEKYQGIHDFILYATDTGLGRFSSEVIKYTLETCPLVLEIYGDTNANRATMVEVVPDFGRRFWHGLLNLAEEVIKDVAKNRHSYDLIVANLTAGFKPESGFLLLVSSLIGVDKAYYIHESMSELVEIPIIPMKIDENIKKLMAKVERGEALTEMELLVLQRIGLASDERIDATKRGLIRLLYNAV